MKWPLLALAVVGCATAGAPSFGERPDGQQVTFDSTILPGRDGVGSAMIDAPRLPPDATQPGQPQTLTQATSATDEGVAIACGNGSIPYTSKNSYYRVFTLSDYGITGAFAVSSVDFVVSTALTGPKLKVSVGTYSATPGGNTLTASDITLATSQTMTLPEIDTAQDQNVPITATIPASSNLVVEIDQTNTGTATNGIAFYIGASSAGESKPGYVLSTDCSVNTPTSMTMISQSQSPPGGETDIIVSVTGTPQ